VGGETPGVLDDHPDGQPDAGRVLRHRNSSIAQPDQLLGGPLDADVGVLGAQLTRPSERGVGHLPQRQGKELWIDHAGTHMPTLTGRPLQQPLRQRRRGRP
jgi:hypothetical protein